MKDLLKWDVRYLQLAFVVASWSKDPSTKVGAVCVSERHNASFGCNGLPRGYPEDSKILNDRPEKLKRVLHAEENCILNNTGSLIGTTMYITHPPCLHCCSMMAQAGVSRVVAMKASERFESKWNTQESTQYLWDLEIPFQFYRKEDETYIYLGPALAPQSHSHLYEQTIQIL